MREMVDEFDPSREPLRPMEQARMAWTQALHLARLGGSQTESRWLAHRYFRFLTTDLSTKPKDPSGKPMGFFLRIPLACPAALSVSDYRT